MKDGSKLFAEINSNVYEHWFNRLLVYRKKHPEYRDDQLLMYLLCTEADYE